MFERKREKDVAFEESLGDDWQKDLDVIEVPIGNKPLFYLGALIFLAGLVFAARILYLDFYLGQFYVAKAEANISQYWQIPAPRGLIFDRNGAVLAENEASFAALLDTKEFLRNDSVRDKTLGAVENILGISAEDVLGQVAAETSQELASPIVLNDDLTQSQLVQLEGLNLPTLAVRNDFKRKYIDSPIFSDVVGYTGLVSPSDMKTNPDLGSDELIGRAGVEAFYDDELRGQPGEIVAIKNSRGEILSQSEKSQPQVGQSLRLTIDGDFQRYFYERLQAGLNSLGRKIGLGLAINPQNGEILALVGLPSFDSNVLSSSGHSAEKSDILNSPDKPLFSRAVSGFYNPGSTIKPLVGIAALSEGVIDPSTEIFSPGYLDIPNPYDPSRPTRYLDWRYQGNVNLASAIAQSSNVYFYTVGGGAATQILKNGVAVDTGRVGGLGINRLDEWWQKFGLGEKSGVDLPNEASGFLPTAEQKEKKTGTPWLLGDTYNVSIGQGDLLVTPIQLLNYISSIANGGKIYEPVVNLAKSHPQLLGDLSYLEPEIREVEKGMVKAVTSPLGSAYKLNDLGFSVAAKTGTPQIKNNEQVNALFVGYAPVNNPQIAVLVLVENALEGSLNAIPIAKDVLNWYYWNRIYK